MTEYQITSWRVIPSMVVAREGDKTVKSQLPMRFQAAIDEAYEKKLIGKKVAAYGAAAKGNTLLNYAGVRGDLIAAVVDRNPAKQGKFLPCSRIPIVSEDELLVSQPDYVVILPWNLRVEVMQQLGYISKWGAKFVMAVPKLEIVGS